MIVELHLLQNFAPSNLNRDDTGSPKDCEFGGYRRARISSQCQKRAVREAFKNNKLLPSENRAERTKRLTEAVARRLEAKGRSYQEGLNIAEAAVPGTGLRLKEGQTEYLVFLGADELDRIATVCDEHWQTLAATQTDAKASKKEAKAALPKGIADELLEALNGRRAADLALFGRMLADLPGRNRDASCQVAHAISTNHVTADFDFFTAVDDLKPRDEDAGAGMLGTVEFNSSCYYRYANIDLDQLSANLDGDTALVAATVRAFLTAFVDAVPTGKQNSFAAQNPPSLVFAVVRGLGVWSLTNAFVRPVVAGRDGDLIQASIEKLDGYWGRLTMMYGDGSVLARPVCVDSGYGNALSSLKESAVPSVGVLIDQVLAAASLDGL